MGHEITRMGHEITRMSQSNPAAAYLAGLSATGRRTMAQALNTIAQRLGYDDALAMPWHALRYEHVEAIKTWLLESGRKPATVNKYLAALRGVLRAAWLMGLIGAEDYRRAAAVKSVRASTLPAGRELSKGEIAALMAACTSDDSPAGVRDAAIIGVMYVGGLRRSEVVALTVDDVDIDAGRITVRAGKGRKERTVYLTNGALDALRDWLAVRGDTPGALFVPVLKNGVLQYRRLTTQAVYNMLRKRAAQAGVKAFSPHDVRRTFVSHLLAAGADIAIVARLAGHASVTTTARYDRRPEEAKARAAQLLHLPYTR